MAEILLTREQVVRVLEAKGVTSHTVPRSIAILAVRDSDGDGNEFNVYDDRMFVVSQTEFRVFPANTDPSKFSRGMAQVSSDQVITYQPGRHKFKAGYAAFRQFSAAKFFRQGYGEDTGIQGFNIHKGSGQRTSSEGCQTLPPAVWDGFRNWIYGILGVKVSQAQKTPGGFGPKFQYLLMDRKAVEALLGISPGVPPQPVTPKPMKYIFEGKEIKGVVSVAGLGFAPTRKTLALMTGLAPESLVFTRAQGEEVDQKPDLIWRSPDGSSHPIDTLDVQSSETLGRISQIAQAAGLSWSVDGAAGTVVFKKSS